MKFRVLLLCLEGESLLRCWMELDGPLPKSLTVSGRLFGHAPTDCIWSDDVGMPRQVDTVECKFVDFRAPPAAMSFEGDGKQRTAVYFGFVI